MPFNLPRVTLHHLPSAPLKLALVQVRHRAVLAVEQADRVAEFQSTLGRRYEFLDQQRSHALTVFLGPVAVEPPQVAPSETIWRFRERERGWVVALSSGSLGFEAPEYRDFNEFIAEFSRVVGVVARVFSPSTQTRLGVRYINEIEDSRVTNERIGYFLREELVAPINSELGSDLVSSLSDLKFRQPDGTFILRHGLVRPDTYLLDFDYFNEDEVSFEAHRIRQQATSYHDLIESVFVWSLTKEYLTELEEATMQ